VFFFFFYHECFISQKLRQTKLDINSINLAVKLEVGISGLSHTSNALVLHTAQISASQELEHSVHSPCDVPRVVDDPIVHVIGVIMAPANDLNGVTTKVLTTSLIVDTTSVGHEVGVNIEGAFNWTIIHDFCLDLGSGTSDLVVSLGLVLILSECHWVTRSARARASGSVGFRSRASLGSTWRNHVGLATAVGSVPTTSDDTSPGPVFHGVNWVTTSTSVTTVLAASHDLLSGHDNSGRSFIKEGIVFLGHTIANAHSVGNDFRGSHGPAASTVSLILDVTDGAGAVWPLCSRGEIGWESSRINVVIYFRGCGESSSVHSGSHQAHDLFFGFSS